MLLIPSLHTLSTEWGFSLGESPWDKSEVWKDEGDSGRKDEIFSDAHFGLMPKTVLLKASAFRLLDHVTVPVGETLSAICTWLAVVPYSGGHGLGRCIYNLLPRFFCSSRTHKLNFPSEVSCSCSWVQHPPLPSSETQMSGNTFSSFTAFSTELPSIKSPSQPLVQFPEIGLAEAVTNC